MSELIASLGIIVALGVLGYAYSVYNGMKSLPEGNEKMKEIASAIHEGAMVFLRSEYKVIGYFVGVIFILLGFGLGWPTAIAYICGAGLSCLAGFFGMMSATKANVRTAQAAASEGQGAALSAAFKGGNVMGLSVAGLGLLGLSIGYAFLIGLPENPAGASLTGFVTKFAGIIGGFAMGASSVALFARIGGGIFTKAADVGADLVGKVEAGIPEDDPRNPATIADNVGDNVGDVAGMGADLFESYVGSVIATIVIAAGMEEHNRIALMAIPIVLITIGSIASILGSKYIDRKKDDEPQSVLRYGTFYAGGIYLGVSLIVLAILGLVDAIGFWFAIKIWAISCVRSETETSMMFMMPMPPTSRLMPTMQPATMVMTAATALNWSMTWARGRAWKVSGSSGSSFLILRSVKRTSAAASSAISGETAWAMIRKKK